MLLASEMTALAAVAGELIIELAFSVKLLTDTELKLPLANVRSGICEPESGGGYSFSSFVVFGFAKSSKGCITSVENT